MIVKQILLLFSTILLAVTGLPHDLNYKEKYDNLESHSSAPFFDQDKVQSVMKTSRPKEKLNLKPCSRRFNSDSSLDSDQLIQTSSHVVVIPESLDSNRLDSQKHYTQNKNNVKYFDDEDLLQTKSTESEQESEPVTKENIVNYIRSPKKNKVSVISSFDPSNLSQQESVDISGEAQPIQSPFRVLKSQHVSVEDAYDTLESLARAASSGYDNEQITAHYPSVKNYKKVNKKLSLLNHNPKNVRNPTKLINRGQDIDNSLSVQENDENYDAITYALEMEMAEQNQNEKYDPQVFKSIAKLLSIYEQNNEEQELPTKARLVVNPGRNNLKAQSLKKYDDTFEDTNSIQDNRNSVKNNLSNLRSKFNAEQSPKTYEESYANLNNVDNYIKSQSLKYNNGNEESISQESNLTEESEESEINLKLVQNNLRDSLNKNKIGSVIISYKDYFNNQKDREDTHEPNSSQSYITLQKQLHHNSNSESEKPYEDMNSEQRSEEDSNYFSESEQDSSHEMKKSQLSDKKSNLSSSKSHNSRIVKLSPLVKDKKHLFNLELSSAQNLSQEVDENSQNHLSPGNSHLHNNDIEDISESSKNNVQKSNSHHQVNSPVSKVTTSLKGRNQLLNDDSINLSSSQEEEDSAQYRSSHKSHKKDSKSNLSDYQDNEDNRVSGRYQYLKVQVPEIRVKEKKHLVNDQVSNHKSSNQNLIDQNLTQEVNENSQNHHSSPRDSHRQNYDLKDLSESSENNVQKSNSHHQINSPVSKATASPKVRKLLLNDDNINQSSSPEEEDSPQYHNSHKSHDEDNKSNLSDYQENEDKRVSGRYQNKVSVPEIRAKEETHSVINQVPNHKSSHQNLIDQNLTQEEEENSENYHSSPRISHHQDYGIDDLSESLKNQFLKSNSRHQINRPILKVTASPKVRKLLLEDDNINQSSSPEEENSSRYYSFSHKSYEENNKSNLSDYQENEDKRVSGRYQHKGQIPEIRVKEEKHLVNDHSVINQVSNHKSSYQNFIDQNLTQEEEENSENYHNSPRDSHRQNYDIEDLSESSENNPQKSNSHHQTNSPVSKVTTSLKDRKQLLNDDSINLSSSQEEEDSPQYRSSHKSHEENNKSNLSSYHQNENKQVNGRYRNKAQVAEVRVNEKKHLVNDKVSYGKSLNQKAELNVDDSSSQKEPKTLIYPISHHKSLPENKDNSQSNDLSGSLQNKNNNLDTHYQSTVSVPLQIIVKDKKHLINDELSSDQLFSQESEKRQNYRSSPHKSQNHDDSQSNNLIESDENFYNSLKSHQQVTAVVKNSHPKSKYEAKEIPQYHSTLPDVLSSNYDDYFNTSEIHQSEGKSLDDGYKPKTSQTIKTIAKDTISYNINEEDDNKENINDDYVVDISADNLNNGDGENFTPIVDISFHHNSGLRNSYLDNIKDSTCHDRLDLSTDYGQSSEALPNDELEQNVETESRTGDNEQLDEDESQSDDGGCIKDKIKLSENSVLNPASRRFLNNYFEEEHQDQEEEEEKADIEDVTEEMEASEEIVERDVEESEQQNSESQNSLFNPSIGKGVREFSESRTLLSQSSRLVCYACSTLSDPTCWAPDGKTTVKYCQRGHDSCIQRTYEGKDALIMVRDCAVSCEGETVPGLSLKYKTCEVCHSDLCNSAYTAFNSLNLMVMLGVITFVKYVF